MSDALDGFSAPVRAWFRDALGAPTPPQSQGWPAIQRGQHTLILAPTGSGKTLAAFLWGIDRIIAEQAAAGQAAATEAPPGVRVVYISPLKALNNDVERNLRAPLDGIRAAAEKLDQLAPDIHVAVRTGDTPGASRAQMLKRPPHILITTPESLYLMLTSPRARELFRTAHTVIVDEIHTLCGNKRGAHLALSLERLTHAATGPVQRIGLSATIRPLEEAARFLGGQEPIGARPDAAPRQRPVAIVDAHYDKALDLKVITAVDDLRELPGGSIWPAVIPRVLADVYRHRTTLIFANNRRLAERTADRLNAQLEAERNEEVEPGSTAALAPHGYAADRGMFAIGAEGPIRAHHGSMSKEARRKMEEDLKAGRLPALVGTSSLELGIDIGTIDLVVQLQSPKSVAQGLQRVGRSGHLVGQTSRGHIYATFSEDLLEAAAIARGMLDRDVEPTATPQNALDVLAQHIVAMVAMEDWPVDALHALVRCAYPYRDLSLGALHSVLDMLAGKYYLDAPHLRSAAPLRPKIAWDRARDVLTALPGTRMLAMSNAGTIPDTGAYGAYLSDGKTKIGELDEEFIFESRTGDTFLLGSKVWRVTEIKDDRIIVADAAGATPRMPFWRGDYPYRPYDLGVRIGRFRREVLERIAAHPGDAEALDVIDWLKRDYVLDDRSARNLIDHVRRQLDATGVMSSDTTIVVETFQNAVGDPHLAVHSPFGGRVNGAWALALSSAIAEQTGVAPEMQVNDDGMLFRLAPTGRPPPVDVVRTLTGPDARERILAELPHSAAFGAQFRMNAARALLLPRAKGGKRTPFWLQRLKAKDLLALVSKLDDFPILTETYRDCLRDVFDLAHLEEVLGRIQDGAIGVTAIETLTPSPIASGLLYNFTEQYLYEWDAPKAERQLQALSLPRQALAELLKGATLSELLKPEAIADVRARAQHRLADFRARTAEELMLLIRELGDLSTSEAIERCAGDGTAWLDALTRAGRIIEIDVGAQRRWIPAELAPEYAELAAGESEAVLRRCIRAASPATRAAILERYPFQSAWLDATLARWVEAGEIVRGAFTAPDAEEYCETHRFEQIHQRTLALLRKEAEAVSPAAYAHFLVGWQHAHPATRWRGPDAARRAVEQLRGVALPIEVWERDALPTRVDGYRNDLDALSGEGDLVWVASGRDPRRAPVRLFFRGEGGLFLAAAGDAPELGADDQPLGPNARAALDFLKAEGASYAAEVQAGLGLDASALAQALAELALGGLATHDAIAALRRAIDAERDAPAGRRPISALAEDLSARLAGLGPRPAGLGSRPVSHGRYREAKRRVSERLRAEGAGPAALTPPAGRWSLVHRAGVLGPAQSPEARAERLVRLLLARYGVLVRECLEREDVPWDWSQLYPLLDRMEMRGEVRRGYFVAGLSGVQFALPGAVEQLRAAAAAAAGDDAVVVLNALDPVLVDGPEGAEGLRFARVPSTHIALIGGARAMVIADRGERIALADDLPIEVAERVLRAYLSRPFAEGRVVVKQWNGARVLGGPGQAVLKSLGFDRTADGMERS